MKSPFKLTTANGGTVEAIRVGIRWDLNVRDAAGRTVATVDMSDDDMWALVGDIEDQGDPL
ncbi:hypothetical protein [Streptomyces malaysiensis]